MGRGRRSSARSARSHLLTDATVTPLSQPSPGGAGHVHDEHPVLHGRVAGGVDLGDHVGRQRPGAVDPQRRGPGAHHWISAVSMVEPGPMVIITP
ncbi:hypothetical protein GCM10020001_117910 [Nonomuraea salmonea]